MERTDPEPTLCRIELELGRREVCPGEACAFWEPAGKAGGACSFDELDLAGRADRTVRPYRRQAQL
jgi:hypothetical protein